MRRRSLETAKKERHRGKLLIDEKRRRSLPHPLDTHTFLSPQKTGRTWYVALSGVPLGRASFGANRKEGRRTKTHGESLPSPRHAIISILSSSSPGANSATKEERGERDQVEKGVRQERGGRTQATTTLYLSFRPSRPRATQEEEGTGGG